MDKYAELFNKTVAELIKDVVFIFNPALNCEYAFREMVPNALKHHTETTLQCSFEEYTQAYNHFNTAKPDNMPVPLNVMFVALQAIMSVTPDKLFSNKQVDRYIFLRPLIKTVESDWQAIAQPYYEEAKKVVQAEQDKDMNEAKAAQEREMRMRGIKNKRIILPR